MERIRQMERKKIIKVFGGFLAVMLSFTILSRAVSGASTAQVETVRIKTGAIDHRVTGSGRAGDCSLYRKWAARQGNLRAGGAVRRKGGTAFYRGYG